MKWGKMRKVLSFLPLACLPYPNICTKTKKKKKQPEKQTKPKQFPVLDRKSGKDHMKSQIMPGPPTSLLSSKKGV